MREGGISVAPAAALAVLAIVVATGPTSAQQTAPPSATSQDQSQAPPPPPKPKHTKKISPAAQTNPDLDTNDQLAPSQMPAAVSQPGAAPAKPAHPAGASHAAAMPSATSHVIACSGLFAKDTSHLKLAMTFEAKNITFADVDAEGGTKVPASVLFPTDPKRRLEVWWSNPAERSGLYLIDIHGKSTWTAPGGMKLGLTLAQLEKLNGKPFKLKGFDKSGVAAVSDWDGDIARRLQIRRESHPRSESHTGCDQRLDRGQGLQLLRSGHARGETDRQRSAYRLLADSREKQNQPLTAGSAAWQAAPEMAPEVAQRPVTPVRCVR